MGVRRGRQACEQPVRAALLTRCRGQRAPRRDAGDRRASRRGRARWPTLSGSPTSAAGNGAWPRTRFTGPTQLYRIFGTRHSGPIGGRTRDVLDLSRAGAPRGAGARCAREIEEALGDVTPFRFEHRIVRPDGRRPKRALPGRAHSRPGHRSDRSGRRRVPGRHRDGPDREGPLRGRRSLSKRLRERADRHRAGRLRRGPRRAPDRGQPRALRSHRAGCPRSSSARS